MKFDRGVFMFRKLLRDAISGSNPAATGEGFRKWLEADSTPNSYCSGNVLIIPAGATAPEEVEKRRRIAQAVVDAMPTSSAHESTKRIRQDECSMIVSSGAWPEMTNGVRRPPRGANRFMRALRMSDFRGCRNFTMAGWKGQSAVFAGDSEGHCRS